MVRLNVHCSMHPTTAALYRKRGRKFVPPARTVYLTLLLASIGALSSGQGLQSAFAAEYTLMPSPQTVHIGNFNAALKPVLTIDSGDIVTLESATHIDPAEIDASGVVPPGAVPDYTRAISGRSKIAVLRRTF